MTTKQSRQNARRLAAIKEKATISQDEHKYRTQLKGLLSEVQLLRTQAPMLGIGELRERLDRLLSEYAVTEWPGEGTKIIGPLVEEAAAPSSEVVANQPAGWDDR